MVEESLTVNNSLHLLQVEFWWCWSWGVCWITMQGHVLSCMFIPLSLYM